MGVTVGAESQQGGVQVGPDGRGKARWPSQREPGGSGEGGLRPRPRGTQLWDVGTGLAINNVHASGGLASREGF